MIHLFDFDPEHFASEFRSHGVVHIPSGITEEFHEVITRQVADALENSRLKHLVVGDKHQALYDFPDDGCRVGFLKMVAAVTGLDPDRLVISERHIKGYDDDADPSPRAHKDRFQSQVSVGISVRVPPASTLIIYPDADPVVNPFNSSTELRNSHTEEQQPEEFLRRARRLEIQDQPRDLVLFRGNSMWHLRENAANTVMLYFKLNAFNSDPLGEDHRTEAVRAMTLSVLQENPLFLDSVPLLGRKVEYFQKRCNRDWREQLGVVISGRGHVSIDDRDLSILESVNGLLKVSQLVQSLGLEPNESLIRIRRLARCGAIDLPAQES